VQKDTTVWLKINDLMEYVLQHPDNYRGWIRINCENKLTNIDSLCVNICIDLYKPMSVMGETVHQKPMHLDLYVCMRMLTHSSLLCTLQKCHRLVS
jgi:hypothetical protein